ncbi:MAG: 16S rRNA processing protein RimM [Chloroflexi bacterium AL-W]|nr:16S rRNA processing protein RimM [Chloroflexi bacterium AL-W]
MRVLTDYPERIIELDAVYLGKKPDDRSPKSYEIEQLRVQQGYGLLKLSDLHDRNDAESVRGLFVMVKTEDAIPLDDDEIYLFQLIGMEVYFEDGVLLGTLSEVLETGANDVYIVKSRRYGEVLIPATEETILETDPDTNRMTVRLPEGLLPE